MACWKGFGPVIKFIKVQIARKENETYGTYRSTKVISKRHFIEKLINYKIHWAVWVSNVERSVKVTKMW